MNSLFQVNELLQQHSAPTTDIHTMAFALKTLAYMGTQSPKGFKMLGMHERVWELCQELLVGPVIELQDASDILGSLEDLVSDTEELRAEHDSIQVHVSIHHCRPYSLLHVQCLLLLPLLSRGIEFAVSLVVQSAFQTDWRDPFSEFPSVIQPIRVEIHHSGDGVAEHQLTHQEVQTCRGLPSNPCPSVFVQ